MFQRAWGLTLPVAILLLSKQISTDDTTIRALNDCDRYPTLMRLRRRLGNLPELPVERRLADTEQPGSF